ncbi:hypothetical protein [Thermococcus barossii]|uniref:Uncharacterized protein n=1 Tax=Thermococcus barossii TaxID=54077 RepID=A0A2Z2MDA1_9EURY|nr:hypothetical protein [Thermococcus barossii]ASJ04630.1 hypothetical protein A3L01_04315 [Thermococcus barossii]
MGPEVYPLTREKALHVLGSIEDYGVVSVDVDNAASILDDILDSNSRKLQYARRILDDGNVDKAVLVVRDNEGILVIKMENVVEIRVVVRNYRRLMQDLSLEVG